MKLAEAVKLLESDFNSNIKKFSWKKIVKLIEKANDSYYNSGEMLMSDYIYDKLREVLYSMFPQHYLNNNVGSPITKDKVKLPYWMGSMDKIKPDSKKLDKWFKTYINDDNKGYVLSDKLDGVSCIYYKSYTKTGIVEKLYTRGNGEYGQDISYLISYFSIPKIDISNLFIENKILCCRGEIILSKNNFEKYREKNSNARNLVSGLVNSKKFNKELAKDCDVVMYEIIEPTNMTMESQLILLSDMGFKVVNYNVCELNGTSDMKENVLKSYLIKRKQESQYEIDGIIITHNKSYVRNISGNPKYSFAFKMILECQTSKTTVTDIIWTPSKDGYLKPRVKIEPVILGGTKISFTTGFNAKYIKDNLVGPGATIEIVRSGDVIPYINNIIKPTTLGNIMDCFPNEIYEWNDNNVDIILKNPDKNKKVLVKQITGFFKKLGIKGLNEGNIVRIIDTGYDTINKIINLSVDDLLKVDGFKTKMANNIYNNIHTIVDKPIKLEILMSASNKFGRGFSFKKLLQILNIYPDILTKEYTENDICKINGFSNKTSKRFIDHLPYFKNFLDENNFIIDKNIGYSISNKNVAKYSELFNDKKIVFTGFRNKEFEKIIETNGGKITNSVNSKTSFIIKKNEKNNSSKVTKAIEMNIDVFTFEDFIKDNGIVL